MVSFDDWAKLDLRVGLIEEVEDIEGKDRLYKMTVSFGEEKRSVVAGLKEFYSADELKGKKSIFVYNLDPVVLGGVESQAMIMAARTPAGKYKVSEIDSSVLEGTKIE